MKLTISHTINWQFRVIMRICGDTNGISFLHSLPSYVDSRVDLFDFRKRMSGLLLGSHSLDAALTVSGHCYLQVTLIALLSVKRAARVSQARRASLDVYGGLWRRQDRRRLSESEVDACVTSLPGCAGAGARLSGLRLSWVEHAAKCWFGLNVQLTQVTDRPCWNRRRRRCDRRDSHVELYVQRVVVFGRSRVKRHVVKKRLI